MTQYPVLPWTFIANSQKLELENKSNAYRDLTKNMGLNGKEERIMYFL